MKRKISQRQLAEFESLQLEMKALQHRIDAALTDVKHALTNGASVNTGKRGVVSGIRYRRYPSYKEALINAKGEEYQKQILDHCESKPYFFVRFITRNGGKEKA